MSLKNDVLFLGLGNCGCKHGFPFSSFSSVNTPSLYGAIPDPVDPAVECNKDFMLERMTKNGIFAPIENNKICGDIAVVHSGSDDSDITVDNMIAEFGKPFNIFEGYNNGNSTLISLKNLRISQSDLVNSIVFIFPFVFMGRWH